MKHLSKSLVETAAIADGWVKSLAPGNTATVVAMRGDLGSGKTSFVQGVARSFGVKGEVTSPTFVIQKIYKLDGAAFKHLVHIDAYRLDGAVELVRLGWNELLSDPHNLIVVEWPERVQDALPAGAHTLSFTFIDETHREIEY